MSAYRAYQIGSDGHIKGGIDLSCTNDEEAKIQAQQLLDGHDVELWDGNRKIAFFRIEADDPK